MIFNDPVDRGHAQATARKMLAEKRLEDVLHGIGRYSGQPGGEVTGEMNDRIAGCFNFLQRFGKICGPIDAFAMVAI